MIRARVVKPKTFNEDAFASEFLHAADRLGDEIRVEFHKTIRTWHNRPQFKRKLAQNFNETSVEIFTEGKTPPGVRPKTPEDIYCILAGGTKLNFAVMTLDFEPKTAPDVIDSFAGQGGFSHIDLDILKARLRAIEARNWDIVIAADKEKRLHPLFEDAMKKGVKRSNHEYT